MRRSAPTSRIVPVATIVPWLGMSRGTLAVVPSVPGIGERDRGADEVVGAELVRACVRLDELLVAGVELRRSPSRRRP